MTVDILQNAGAAVVTSGGTTAPSAGTTEVWTVNTLVNLTVLTTGQVFRVMDAKDIGKTSGYEIIEITANANGTGVNWSATRGVESTTPWAHASGWTAVAVATAAGLGDYLANIYLPIAGGTLTGTLGVETSGDAHPRFTVLANGEMSSNSPAAPAYWGVHDNTTVGLGTDYWFYFEPQQLTAAGIVMSFPRTRMTDGTNYGFLTYPVPSANPFPLSGSPTIGINVETGSFAALASSGTLQVSDGATPSEGVQTGTVTYTGKLSTSYDVTTTGASAGTFTISIAGYTTATGIEWNASASSIQTTLSDGTHGPANTQVSGPSTGPGVYTINTAGQAVTANFSGLTGGTNTVTENFAITNLTGCSSSGLTSRPADEDPPTGWQLTDGFGATIAWIPSYGGLHVSDRITSMANGVFPSSGDVILGAINEGDSAAGTGLVLGNTADTWVARGETSAGLDSQVLLYSSGFAGDFTHTLCKDGWYPSAPIPLGTPTDPFSSVNAEVVVTKAQGVTVTSNAGTVPVTVGVNNFTNSSSAAMTITMATSGAYDGQMSVVRVYDFAGTAETIGWTNTENSTVSAPTTSNGSTTLPRTVTFQYNGATSKWRCIASV